jgi:hypothetical protein
MKEYKLMSTAWNLSVAMRTVRELRSLPGAPSNRLSMVYFGLQEHQWLLMALSSNVVNGRDTPMELIVYAVESSRALIDFVWQYQRSLQMQEATELLLSIQEAQEESSGRLNFILLAIVLFSAIFLAIQVWRFIWYHYIQVWL